MNDFFELGRVLKPQGIRGEIKAELYTDDIKRIHNLDFVYFKENNLMTKHNIVSAREDGNFAFLFFDFINSRNDAEKIRNQIFYIDRENAVPLLEGHFYICDLIGISVISNNGINIGVVRNVMQNGCADVYEVENEAGELLYFAAAPGVIIGCYPEKGFLTVDEVKLKEVMC